MIWNDFTRRPGDGSNMERDMSDERPADLLFWFKDGHCGGYKARERQMRRFQSAERIPRERLAS